jgi:poly [ADP-ribose] polymerase
MSTTATPTPAKVIETKTYVAVDPSNNNNKFWKYEILDRLVTEPGKNGKPETGDVRITWGRMGASGETQMIMRDKLASKVKSKLNKKPPEIPYTETQTVGNFSANTSAGKAVAKAEVSRIAVKEIGGSCAITSALVKKLAEANKHEIIAMSGGQMDIDLETGIVSTPVGVITLDAIKTARGKLDVMAPFVKKQDTDNLTYMGLISEYLRLVPQKTAFKKGWHTSFINLDAQTSLLDQLETSVELANKRMADASKTGSAAPVNSVFNVTMKLVDDSKIWSMMLAKFNDSRSRMHQSSHLKPVRMFEVVIPHMANAFERSLGNVKTLWHGTRVFNVLSILKRGFVLPNQLSSVQTTGAMYGAGLYFSENSTKSLNYSYGYWDGGSRDNNCYMFMVDVAMGREYVPTCSGNGKKPGFDSCHAIAGRSGVINDEQIVYRTSQANIKYLVEFSS